MVDARPVSFSLFTIMLDNPVVNIALPSIQEDLPIGSPSSSGSSPAKPSPSPRSCSPAASSPIRGRRLIVVAGLVIFTSASLWCGLADSGDMPIAARGCRGGSGADEPRDLSIISATFPPHQRGMAIGIWAGVRRRGRCGGPADDASHHLHRAGGRHVPVDKSEVGSAVLNAFRQVGGMTKRSNGDRRSSPAAAPGTIHKACCHFGRDPRGVGCGQPRSTVCGVRLRVWRALAHEWPWRRPVQVGTTLEARSAKVK